MHEWLLKYYTIRLLNSARQKKFIEKIVEESPSYWYCPKDFNRKFLYVKWKVVWQYIINWTWIYSIYILEQYRWLWYWNYICKEIKRKYKWYNFDVRIDNNIAINMYDKFFQRILQQTKPGYYIYIIN